jgi:uncharacterized protein YbjT (DUF2867 family)
MKAAIIFGVTGLTGKTILGQLIKDPRYHKVYIISRRSTGIKDPKVEEIIFDFKNFASLPTLKADHIFSCMGTTIKKAGSQEAQQMIDRDYPISIAKYAKLIDAEKLICVSSVGTDIKSGNFYLRTKGEMEEGVKEYFPKAVFVRPSFIFGDREERRRGEKIGISIFKVINPLLFGSLSKYKGIDVKVLAQAMINACFINTKQVLHYKDF